MKRSPLLPTTLATLLVAGTTAVAGNLALTDHEIRWSGSMPIKTHVGTLSPESVEASLGDNGGLEALTVVIDMTSIANEDIDKEKPRAKLEGHLRSEDFFHVDEHPTATFAMDHFDGQRLKGTLTIRGVSKEVALPASWGGHEDGYRLTSDFTFNREDFNVDYQNSGLFGVAKNKLIAPEVGVEVVLNFAVAE